MCSVPSADRTHDLPVTRQAELVGIPRSSVYSLPAPVSEADLALMRRIDALHLEHPYAGARMLRDQQLFRRRRELGFSVQRDHAYLPRYTAVICSRSCPSSRLICNRAS